MFCRLVAEEQTLANLLKDKKWTKALRIAISLSQPFRALKVVRELLDETPDQLPGVVAKLNQDHLATLLGFISIWNTKTKNSREAQVHICLQLYLNIWRGDQGLVITTRIYHHLESLINVTSKLQQK